MHKKRALIEKIYLKACEFQKNDRTSKAKLYYKRVLKLDFSDYKTHSNLGVLYKNESDLQNAKKHFQFSIQISPNSFAYNNLAHLQTYEKDFENAKHNFIMALKLNANDSMIYTNVGIYYASTAKLALAVESFKKALEIDPDSQLAKKYLEKLSFTKY